MKSVSPDKGKKDKAKGGKKSPTKKGADGPNIMPEDEITRGKCPLKKRGEEKEEPRTIGEIVILKYNDILQLFSLETHLAAPCICN